MCFDSIIRYQPSLVLLMCLVMSSWKTLNFMGCFSFATQHILEQLRELASTRSPSFLVVHKSPSSVVAHSVYPVRT